MVKSGKKVGAKKDKREPYSEFRVGGERVSLFRVKFSLPYSGHGCPWETCG